MWQSVEQKEHERLRESDNLEDMKKELDGKQRTVEEQWKILEKKDQKFKNLQTWEQALKKQEDSIPETIRADFRNEYEQLEREKVESGKCRSFELPTVRHFVANVNSFNWKKDREDSTCGNQSNLRSEPLKTGNVFWRRIVLDF